MMHNYSEISEIMKQKGRSFFDILGVNAYSIRRFYRNGQKVYLTTLPQWFDFYEKNKFYSLDEFKTALVGTPAFKLWDYWDKNDKDFWKVINCAKTYFNQNHGLCYVKKNKMYVDVINFGADENNRKINERYLNEKERIIKFYDFLQATIVEDLIEKSPKFKCEKYKTVILDDGYNNLSPQETKVLSLWSQGYTLKQIGCLMHLSPRTIETYIERIKIKYNCKFKTDLIEKYHLLNS